MKINFKDLQVSIMNELIEGIKWRKLLEFFYFKFDHNPRKENNTREITLQQLYGLLPLSFF